MTLLRSKVAADDAVFVFSGIGDVVRRRLCALADRKRSTFIATQSDVIHIARGDVLTRACDTTGWPARSKALFFSREWKVKIERKLGVTTVLVSLVGVYGCGDQPPSEGEVRQTDVRTAPVSWEQFLASAYKEPWPGGKYIVDGDIPLRDETDLREYYNSWTSEDSALTVRRTFNVDRIWAFPDRFKLTYCVSTAFAANYQTVIANMATATASWSARVGVRYEYLPAHDASCNQNNANVTFDVRPVSQDTANASAFFPDYARASRSLAIRPSAFTSTAGGRDFQGILRHELGHTLGFRHEHIWLNSPCHGESSADARLATAYDVNSVMHYPECRPSGTGGYRQTQVDYIGAVGLYGVSPALLVPIVL
jgi:hypothetical protein